MLRETSKGVKPFLSLFSRSPRFAKIEEVALTVAALGHDVGHPGKNNAFFINTYDPMVSLANDHHITISYDNDVTISNLSIAISFIIWHVLRRSCTTIVRCWKTSTQQLLSW